MWSASPGDRAGKNVLLLLHGHGGIADDLTSIFPMLAPSILTVAMRGTVPFGDRWTWIPQQHSPLAPLEASVKHVQAWADRYCPEQPVGLIGFSQGAALGVELLRLFPQRWGYAAFICGLRLPSRLTDSPLLKHTRPPTFSAVAGRDDVIGPEKSIEFNAWLNAHTDLDERHYPGLGHEITSEVLRDVAAFIALHT